MRVGVSGGGGLEAGVHADEDADEVGGEGVDEVVLQVGVFAWGRVAGGGAFGFLGAGGGGGGGREEGGGFGGFPFEMGAAWGR